MGVVTVAGELKQSAAPAKNTRTTLRPSLSSRHHADWLLSDVSSDLTVEVGTTSFSLHKFPLVSRSGKIRKLLSESKDPKLSRINLQMVPGGAEAFELAAKFCYGAAVDITLSNVAMLRCAAHHLQMTDDYSDTNLASRAEAFLRDAVFPSIPNSVAVLRHCQPLLPAADDDDVNLVGRLVSEIAANACKEQLTSGLSKLELLNPRNGAESSGGVDPPGAAAAATDRWWGKSLAVLDLDFFQRSVSAMRSKGLKQGTIGAILINYAHTALHGLAAAAAASTPTKGGGFLDAEAAQKKQRLVVETVVGLIPSSQPKRPAVPIAFLAGLLKAAAAAGAASACRANLERRMAVQLDQAILEDVLVPAASGSGDGAHHGQLYDTDVALRIFSAFVNLDDDDEEEDDDDEGRHLRDDDGGGVGDHRHYEFGSPPRSPKQSSLAKVGKLMDGYLAEVALDSNLTASKFVALVELLPDHARVVCDGLYRAVDIFLKVHPNIKESERYRLCKSIDCQKLSQEACSHAAQNERLPVQMAVQVLYFEQLRLRNAMNHRGVGGGGHDQHLFLSSSASASGAAPYFPHRPAGSGAGAGVGSGAASPRDNYALVRRENRELKQEVARMRMRLTDLEKDHVSMKQELVRAGPAAGAGGLLRSFTRKLGKLNDLFRLWDHRRSSHHVSAAANPPKNSAEARLLFQRRRRHSI